MKEVFNELDSTSEVLQILMSPDQPYLQFSTFGNSGSTHVSFCLMCKHFDLIILGMGGHRDAPLRLSEIAVSGALLTSYSRVGDP